MTTVKLDDRICISEDVLFRNLEGEAVLVHLGKSTYFGLDPVGTRIWELLREKARLEEVHTALLREFEVASEAARDDLLRLVGELIDAGLVEVAADGDATA